MGVYSSIVQRSSLQEVNTLTIGPAPQCAYCKHFDDTRDIGMFCKAFPEGIPSDILDRLFDHTKPHPLDNGVQFEQDSDRELEGS